MRLRFTLLVMGLLTVLAVACQREQQPIASPSPSPPALPPAAAVSPAAVATSRVPPPGASPRPAASNEDDDEDDDIDKPWGAEFEIDADANWYFGYAPMAVMFAARPLNGSPPFTYTWNFADGSPPATGETVTHRYENPGSYTPSVTGKDANNETYTVSFYVRVVTPAEYAEGKQIDPNTLPTSTPVGSTPVPGASPVPVPTTRSAPTTR